jgi:hypothetical protein
MIARFFYRFKGAFGKISTIFLAYQLRQQEAGKFKNKRHKAAIKTSDRSGETEGLQRATADFVRFHCPLEAWKRPVQPCLSARIRKNHPTKPFSFW